MAEWRPSPFVRASIALHAAALAWAAAVPGRWRWAAAVVAANQALLGVAGLVPRSRVLGPNLVRLPPAARDRHVALTFDDGPDPETTPRVLELLARHGARASFFLIGRRAARHRALVAAIVDAGHRVENHTWTHANAFALFGPRRQAREIDRAQGLLGDLSGRSPAYFRPPAGLRSPLLDPILARRELRLAAWTRRGFDTIDAGASRVTRRLTRGLEGGDILLLHDGNAARTPAGTPVILDVLPRLLRALEDRGLCAVALPDPTVD